MGSDAHFNGGMAGLEDLERRLKALPPAIAEAARTQNDQNALDFMQRILSIIPRDTGRLAGSLVKKAVGPLGVRVELGDTDPYYLNYLEFGHMDGDKHVPARPFWWPTWRLNKKLYRAATARKAAAAMKAAANGAS